MIGIVLVVCGAVFSFLLSLFLTNVCRRVALRYGIVDRPNSAVKTHKDPTPYLGGVAICASVCSSVVLALWYLGLGDRKLWIVLAGAVMTLLLGLWDDVREFSPRGKLFGQLVVAGATVFWGISIGSTGLDIVNGALTVLWIVTLMNAFNLIDIMDGLAGGTAAISALALAVLLVVYETFGPALLFSATAGATLGFLVYNFHPAKIFMGDAGSMTLGYLFATGLAIGPWTQMELQGIGSLVLLLVVAVPLFELVFLSIVRVSQGKSPFQGSKDHFALRLRKKGLSVRQTVLLTYLGVGILALGAVWGATDTAVAPWMVCAGLLFLFPVGVILARVNMEDGGATGLHGHHHRSSSDYQT